METIDKGTPPAAGARRVECCTEEACDAGLRNRYFEGKRLTPESFRLEQRYGIERRHLLNRALHGWGVVYGYAVTPGDAAAGKAGQLEVGPGLALDELGRELLQGGARWLRYEELIVLDARGAVIERAQAPAVAATAGAEPARPIDERDPPIIVKPPHPKPEPIDRTWVLSVHYAERADQPVEVSDRCHCRHPEWDRTCETVRYSLRPHRAEGQQVLACDCGSIVEDGPAPRGGRRCLCGHVIGLARTLPSPAEERERLCEVEEACARLRVDLRHGVPIARLAVRVDACGRPVLDGPVDPCEPRRLVKRNDLLFDLIVGRDLTRIERFGWARWHRAREPVPFQAFCDAFSGGAVGERQDEYVTRDFWVQFSRPVSTETLLRPDCFAITVLTPEREGGWWQTMRVPIVRVDPTVVPAGPHDPQGTARGARVVVDGGWLEDALAGPRTVFYGGEARVEIEVRGDLILDCNGQAVDANGAGFAPAPPGNGTPGGTFLSIFRVAAASKTAATHKPAQPEGAAS